ncbi:hypothetical protein ACFU6R_31945 [Streptomyces sp. NPDC057499]|uniref:hypothetical protein n=1 Tax=Streptomyces sp. NPDC057499 TaxID=3346150 RepID=UPI0036CB6530
MVNPARGARAGRARFGADAGSMLDAGQLATALKAFGEILGTVLATWQYLGALAAGLLLGLLLRNGGRTPDTGAVGTAAPDTGTAGTVAPDTGTADGEPRRRPLLLVAAGALAFLVSGFLCTVITYPAFGASVVTAARVWGDFLLLYVLLLAGLGVLLGRVLRAHRPGARPAVTAVAAAVCALSCVGLAAPLLRLGTQMEVRAQRWDRQDRALREGAAHGARVLPYTPVSVGRMVEPFGRHGLRPWPAECVAEYYGLDKVTYSRHGAHP